MQDKLHHPENRLIFLGFSCSHFCDDTTRGQDRITLWESQRSQIQMALREAYILQGFLVKTEQNILPKVSNYWLLLQSSPGVQSPTRKSG